MSTTFQIETNQSTEDLMMALPLRRRRPAAAGTNFLTYVVIACAVAGAVTNVLVMTGFCLAGRSKMNVSSVLIANHTILEPPPVPSTSFFD